MKKVVYIVLFLSLGFFGFGGYKYEVLLSNYRGVFFSTDYFSESVSSEIVYKSGESISFGVGFNGIFNIPIYGYSGVLEETLYLGNFLGYVSFVNIGFGKVRLGMLGGVSYRYILDYREFTLFFDIYSKGEWNVWSYDGVIKSISFGGYYTKFVPFKVLFLPWEFEFRVGYRLGSYKFYMGVLGDFDVEYFRVIPAFNLSFEYYVLENLKFGIGNTFRIGNIFNIEAFSQIGFNKNFSVRVNVGVNYITGFVGGVGMFIQI